jgi:cellulose synthase/poly-beta-1,6-N-acetylglucosamine synthase-like glycosyltransferase
MTAIVEGLLLGLLALACLPTLLFMLEVLCALLPPPRRSVPQGAAPRLAVLIPAHNESSGVRVALDSVLPQLRPGDRVLLVADNCSDQTAQVARDAGAEVIERFDSSRRGKGYALDYGVRHLQHDPPAIVIVLDADCEVAAGALDLSARLSAATGRPVQALYTMRLPAGAGPMMPIKQFAWTVKNLVRPLGYQRLRLPCQLMGTGMAFPWGIISNAPLASGHIVEDLKLGLQLARAGTAPLFCPDASVTSVFAASSDGSRAQHTRWEHGHLGMLFGEAPGYLLTAIARGNIGLLALALDLCVPPLALLTLMLVALCLASLWYWAVAASVLPLAIALVLMSCLLVAVLSAWFRFGRQVLALGQLLRAPLYALLKIPLYVGFLVRRQVDWVRSKRDP